MPNQYKSYDPNVDYMEKMQQAAAAGDLEAAAIYEQKRNEKIMGEGLAEYARTYDYAEYLPKTTEDRMKEVFQKLQDREPFRYDLNADKLYQHYKDVYSKQGKLAMEDTIGQAAALTGGYGNSYAQTVGQQAYHAYLGELNELVPELYDRAKADYDAEGDALYRQYSILAQQDQAEKDAALAAWQLAYEQENEAQEQEYERQKEAQDRAYKLALEMLKNGMMPSQEILDSSGLTAEDVGKLYADGSSQSGASSSGGGGGGGGKTENEGKALSNSLWTKLNETYREAQEAGDMSAFYQLRSMLLAQGYNVAPFDTWAKETYGAAYGSGNPPEPDQASIMALGYGPITMERLQELIDAGEVIAYIENGKILYKRVTPPGDPYSGNVMQP